MLVVWSCPAPGFLELQRIRRQRYGSFCRCLKYSYIARAMACVMREDSRTGGWEELPQAACTNIRAPVGYRRCLTGGLVRKVVA